MMQKETQPPYCPNIRWTFTALGMLLLFVLTIAPSYAQSTQGAILGSVKDPAGALISGAAVTLTNTDEGVSRTTTSNASGDYQFLDAKAAHYTVTITATGFEK